MATRFWVGGTGTWDATTTTHWSTASGGAGGASAPTTADSVVFDAASNTGTGAFTVTTSGAPACLDFSTGGAGGALDGVMTLTMAAALSVAGSLTFPATNFATSSTAALTFTATSAKTITTNGVSLTCDVTFNGVAGSWQLQDNLTTARTTTLTNGTLDLNSKILTTAGVSSSNANTRVIAFGTGKISITANNATRWDTSTATGLSFTGTVSIEFTYAGATGTRVIAAGVTAGENETSAPSFKILGGTDIISMSGSAVKSVDFTGFAGSMANQAIKFYGDVTLGAGMTVTSGASAWTFAKTTGTQVFTSNAVPIGPVTRNGAGGTLQLGGALTISATQTLTLTNGTLDLAGFTLTTGFVAVASGTKNLTFNGGSLVVTGAGATAFNNTNPTNFTTTAGSGNGVISLTSASAKTFVGGGSTYAAALNQGGAGALSITGANHFADLTNTTQPASILFTAATTNTFDAFSISGTAGNLITLGSITAASHTLSKPSGVVSVNFVTISRSTATGGATWYSLISNGNVDGGNNSGWIFGPLPFWSPDWATPWPPPRLRQLGLDALPFAPAVEASSAPPFTPPDAQLSSSVRRLVTGDFSGFLAPVSADAPSFVPDDRQTVRSPRRPTTDFSGFIAPVAAASPAPFVSVDLRALKPRRQLPGDFSAFSFYQQTTATAPFFTPDQGRFPRVQRTFQVGWCPSRIFTPQFAYILLAGL